MSHGNASNRSDPAKTLRDELRDERRTLLRQRDQYVMAMDTATDPKVSIRLQRTLERIEEEIEGLDEALQALPIEPLPEVEPGLPDWDEEPSTAIYDPDEMRLPVEPGHVGSHPTPELPDASGPADLESSLGPRATEAEIGSADPTASSVSQAEPAELQSNPLGPVWMDGLSPPTGQIASGLAEEAVASDQVQNDAIDAVGDDPFALPGQSAAAEASEANSPFPEAPSSSMLAPVSILGDDDDDATEWGWGARVGVFLALGGFLAGVFYVLSIN